MGPRDWLAGHGTRGASPVVFDDLETCLEELARGAGEAPAIFLHGPHLVAAGHLAGLAPWLVALADVDASAVAVLVGGDIDGRTCATLMRAGLFDFVAAGEPAQAWRELRARILRRRARAATGRAMSTEAESTQRMLRDQWRQVQADAAREAAALVRAQTDVEVLNRQLAAHMEQLSLLYRFGRELSVAKNWDATLKGFLEHLAPFVGAVGAALVLRAAPRGGYAPRQIYRWDEASWDRVLVNVTREVDGAVAGNLLAPGVFRIGGGRSPAAGGITALPLEHQGGRLGYLLLLFATHEERERRTAGVLPFLQMVQVVLSEEVAGAQLLDRLREISAFNARVLQTVRSAIWVCDQSARTIFVNHAARRLLGVEVLRGARRPAGRGGDRARPDGRVAAPRPRRARRLARGFSRRAVAARGVGRAGVSRRSTRWRSRSAARAASRDPTAWPCPCSCTRRRCRDDGATSGGCWSWPRICGRREGRRRRGGEPIVSRAWWRCRRRWPMRSAIRWRG